MLRRALTSMAILAATLAFSSAASASAQAQALGPFCDLTVAKHFVGPPEAGRPATYWITVTNAGGGLCIGPIVLRDVLPSGVSPAASATGWSCATGGGCSHVHAVGLAPGSQWIAELPVEVGAEAGDLLGTCATVTSGLPRPTGSGDGDRLEPSLVALLFHDADLSNNSTCRGC